MDVKLSRIISAKGEQLCEKIPGSLMKGQWYKPVHIKMEVQKLTTTPMVLLSQSAVLN